VLLKACGNMMEEKRNIKKTVSSLKSPHKTHANSKLNYSYIQYHYCTAVGKITSSALFGSLKYLP
jgi:hypothetical protein